MPSESNVRISSITQTIEQLGLAQNEAILYEALLKTAKATIPELVKTTPFSRTLLYYLLGNLEGYGLITSQKEGSKTHYMAEPPEKLAEMIGDREQEFKKQKDLLHNVMGDLYSAYRLAHNKPGVKFFEGEEGIKEVLEDTLTHNTARQLLTFSDVAGYATYLADWNTNYYAVKRKKLGIHEKVIIPNEQKALSYMAGYKGNEVTEILFIDHKLFPFQTEINIYEDKVSFVTFSEKTHIGVIIQNREINQTMASIFNFAWQAGQVFSKALQPPFATASQPATESKPSTPATIPEEGATT